MDKFIEKDGKVYLQVICHGCDAALLFHLEKEERRVHAACMCCGHYVEVNVPKLSDAK